MLDLHALGSPGGAGRKQDIGQVVRPDRRGREDRLALGWGLRQELLRAHLLRCRLGQQFRQLPRGQDERHS